MVSFRKVLCDNSTLTHEALFLIPFLFNCPRCIVVLQETQLIWLKDYLVYLPQGSTFDPAAYIDSAVAPDGTGLPASQVSIDNQVSTAVPGVYYAGYTVTAQGQSYTVYLTVVVE